MTGPATWSSVADVTFAKERLCDVKLASCLRSELAKSPSSKIASLIALAMAWAKINMTASIIAGIASARIDSIVSALTAPELDAAARSLPKSSTAMSSAVVFSDPKVDSSATTIPNKSSIRKAISGSVVAFTTDVTRSTRTSESKDSSTVLISASESAVTISSTTSGRMASMN